MEDCSKVLGQQLQICHIALIWTLGLQEVSHLMIAVDVLVGAIAGDNEAKKIQNNAKL